MSGKEMRQLQTMVDFIHGEVATRGSGNVDSAVSGTVAESNVRRYSSCMWRAA